MTDLELKLKQLEQEKQKLEKQVLKEAEEEKNKLGKSIEGKYFKSVGIGGTSNNSSYIIQYCKIGTFSKCRDTDYIYDKVLQVTICFNKQKLSRSSWKTTLDLQYPILKTYITDTKENGFTINNSYRVHEISKDSKSVRFSSNWYKEVSETEFNWAYSVCSEIADIYFDKFYPALDNSYPQVHESISYLEIENLVELNKLLANGMSIADIKRVAGRVKKYNHFDSRGLLAELCQYDTTGQNGLNLRIVGGNDGTDYEPYTTHYYVGSVNIDWPTILYPIRTTLKSVLDCAEALSNLSELYYPDNWEVKYDNSTYDAMFEYCKLRDYYLGLVNDTIKSFQK